MGPLIVPNSFMISHKENKTCTNLINKSNLSNVNIKNNNIYNNYLSHKNASSEINSIFLYNNNSISNSNTTCNTHTNSNNKSNSFHKSILKKNSDCAVCRIKSKKLDKKLKQNQFNEDKNKNLYFIGESKLLLNTNNNYELKSENYIKNAEEYIDDILENL